MNERDDNRFFEVLLRHDAWRNRVECDRCGDTWERSVQPSGYGWLPAIPGFHTCDGCGRRTLGTRDLCPDCLPAIRHEKKAGDATCQACNTRLIAEEPACVECGTPV